MASIRDFGHAAADNVKRAALAPVLAGAVLASGVSQDAEAAFIDFDPSMEYGFTGTVTGTFGSVSSIGNGDTFSTTLVTSGINADQLPGNADIGAYAVDVEPSSVASVNSEQVSITSWDATVGNDFGAADTFTNQLNTGGTFDGQSIASISFGFDGGTTVVSSDSILEALQNFDPSDNGDFIVNFVGGESGFFGTIDTDSVFYRPSEVPLPPAAYLFGTALFALWSIRRRDRKSQASSESTHSYNMA